MVTAVIGEDIGGIEEVNVCGDIGGISGGHNLCLPCIALCTDPW